MRCYNEQCKYHEVPMPEQRPHTAFCSDACKSAYWGGQDITPKSSTHLSIPEIQERLKQKAAEAAGKLYLEDPLSDQQLSLNESE